jgi:uncharacterized protein YbjT (DUF2867 family)
VDATVLLTGATGYIGGRLLRRFEEGGRTVRCLVRQAERLAERAVTTEVVQGDCLDEASLGRALAGVHTGYCRPSLLAMLAALVHPDGGWRLD